MLTNPELLLKQCQRLALLDAILCPEWDYRYFSFNAHWNKDNNEQMASMRDGTGTEYFILFSPQGVVGKLLVLETQLENSTSALNQVPDVFQSFKTEPAFDLENASGFFWYEFSKHEWYQVPSTLQSEPLEYLQSDLSYYYNWAIDYYEREINYSVLEQVANNLTINAEQLAILNPDLILSDLQPDLDEILG